LPIRQKKIIAVATNEININSEQFKKAKKIVDLWVAPSQMMLERLTKAKVDVKYQPFYVDENIFKRLNNNKKELAQELKINYTLLKNKLLIGSFQRDSLGNNLSMPKIVKNPQLIIDILKNLPKDKYVLVLAGPRRHWLLDKCRKMSIPYIYVGQEPKHSIDDLRINTLDKISINKLYNLIDYT
jgi:hypothetical protein